MPDGDGLKDERPTSNIERPTLNKKTNIQYRTYKRLFLFLFSPSTPLRALSLSNGRFDTGNENLNQFFFHSTFDVGRSMFDVHLFSVLSKSRI